MINNKSIGRKLKELRKSRDLKQSELATEKYLLSNLDALLKDHIAKISSITSEAKNTTDKELKDLRKELDNLNYIFIKKRMPVSTYERLYAETEDKIKRLESFKPQSTDHLKQFLSSCWQSIYENLTRENKRTLWRNIIDSVHVSPDGIEVKSRHFCLLFTRRIYDQMSIKMTLIIYTNQSPNASGDFFFTNIM